MSHSTHRVRVQLPETPQELRFVESQRHGFTLEARTHDQARRIARERLEKNGLVVRSITQGPDNVINVLARDPKAGQVRS